MQVAVQMMEPRPWKISSILSRATPKKPDSGINRVVLYQAAQVSNDILDSLLSMRFSHNLNQVAEEVLNSIQKAGTTFEKCSIYLQRESSDAVLYSLRPPLVEFRVASPDEAEDVRAIAGQRAPMAWQAEGIAGVDIPNRVGVLSFERSHTPFTQAEVDMLAATSNAVMMLSVTHQNLAGRLAITTRDSGLQTVHGDGYVEASICP